MSKVDFDHPVEAYHEDGRVMEITCVHPWGNEQWPRCGVADGEHIFMGALGVSRSTYGDMSGWAVRNVAEPKDDVPEWAVKRVRDLTTDIGYTWLDAFARYVAAHEDEPVDPVILKARELAKPWLIYDHYSIDAGDHDDVPAMAAIREAIEFGRILERGEGK